MSLLVAKSTRPAAQAGRFYEADPQLLRRSVVTLLEASPRASYCKPPLALLAPHAGYVYSGSVAAAAYRTIQQKTFDRVMILAPTHTTSFTGAALAPYAAFDTPLGRVPVDQPAVDELLGDPHFLLSPEAHAQEHAIEVELPFLQVALAGPFHILPIALGEIPQDGLKPIADRLGDLLLQRGARCQRWLIVASSDTYHGYDREACLANDRKLMTLLTAMNSEELVADSIGRQVMACGWKGLAVTMMVAKRLGARECRILEHRDSSEARTAIGDDPGRYVVGYISAAFQ